MWLKLPPLHLNFVYLIEFSQPLSNYRSKTIKDISVLLTKTFPGGCSMRCQKKFKIA